jgi:phage recombination protein Bet
MSQAAAISHYDQPEVIATIKQTVAKGASDAQLQMFLEVCRGTGLNPFLKEIWFIAEKGIIMAGRDGYLRVANEDPSFDGMETRVERDSNSIPVKATCTVWRKDRAHPIICEAYYSEYRKTSPVWSQYPSAMISKVAEVLALKRSFSINGVVTEEEIGFEGSGSKAAAQEVAERKIREIRERRATEAAAQAVPELTYEAIPDDAIPHESPTELEQQLRDSIEMAERQKKTKSGAKSARKIDMLQAFGELKKRYRAIGMEGTYYAALGHHGAEHSSDFEDTERGLSKARVCFKMMQLNCADMEAHTATQKEAGKSNETTKA